MPIARRSAYRQAPFAPLPFGLSLRTVRIVPLGHSVRDHLELNPLPNTTNLRSNYGALVAR